MALEPATMALVLQGGGALGAFELGAMRALYSADCYGPDDFAPGLIAGVSIGAITATLLARPGGGRSPLQALEAFWERVSLDADFLPAPLRPYASTFGNPNYFMPRLDFAALPFWTSFYEVEPLRRTLAELVDLDRLADPDAAPRLLLTATNVAQGQIQVFDSVKSPLGLDHVLASGSLPPGFPMTEIDGAAYWDGGLFDNTPLGAVLDCMDGSPAMADRRQVIVVNLFPNEQPLPQTMAEVGQRCLNLMFCNKTASDLGLIERFNKVAVLLDHIRRDHPELARSKAFTDADHYIKVKVLEITRVEGAEVYSAGDFSRGDIDACAKEGHRAALDAFRNAAG